MCQEVCEAGSRNLLWLIEADWKLLRKHRVTQGFPEAQRIPRIRLQRSPFGGGGVALAVRGGPCCWVSAVSSWMPCHSFCCNCLWGPCRVATTAATCHLMGLAWSLLFCITRSAGVSDQPQTTLRISDEELASSAL